MPSLGNDVETIIGPGDSIGAALRQTADGWELVGINTFTDGYGGVFGDTGGGILVESCLDWIYGTTGVSEPGCMAMWISSAAILLWRRKKKAREALLYRRVSRVRFPGSRGPGDTIPELRNGDLRE